MIKDIKLGLSLMKYGLNYRLSIFGVLFSLGATILFGLLLPIAYIGGMLLSMIPMLIAQLIFSLTVSTMVQASAYKKRLQTTVPTVFAAICILVANTIVVVSQWLHYQKAVNNTNPFVVITYEPGEYETGFIFMAIFLVWILLYTTLAMKHFWLGTILMLGGFWGVMTYAKMGKITYLVMPEWLAIVLSYVIVLLGCVVFYIISCITYKQNYSEITFDSLLKRAS
ncbi:MAG: hypothetical protein IJO60_06040 [Agathobacter sp.]|nr:hypothetical protein [Agathobacter sp.]